jgi:poly(A) polymerase Pap1
MARRRKIKADARKKGRGKLSRPMRGKISSRGSYCRTALGNGTDIRAWEVG